ncbi:MAG: hypothetical protein V4641_01960 [Pseudomonadota bacterium]
MTIKQPFYPQYGSNQVVAPAAASATISINPDAKQVRVVNTGAAIGYFRTFALAGGAQSATTADCPVPAGTSIVVTTGPLHDRLSYISATGTTFQVMTGEGFI